MNSLNDAEKKLRQVKTIIPLKVEAPKDFEGFKNLVLTLKEQTGRSLEVQFSPQNNLLRMYDTTNQVLFHIELNPTISDRWGTILSQLGSAVTLIDDINKKEWGFFAFDSIGVAGKIAAGAILLDRGRPVYNLIRFTTTTLKFGTTATRLSQPVLGALFGFGVDVVISTVVDQAKLAYFADATNKSYKDSKILDAIDKIEAIKGMALESVLIEIRRENSKKYYKTTDLYKIEQRVGAKVLSDIISGKTPVKVYKTEKTLFVETTEEGFHFSSDNQASFKLSIPLPQRAEYKADLTASISFTETLFSTNFNPAQPLNPVATQVLPSPVRQQIEAVRQVETPSPRKSWFKQLVEWAKDFFSNVSVSFGDTPILQGTPDRPVVIGIRGTVIHADKQVSGHVVTPNPPPRPIELEAPSTVCIGRDPLLLDLNRDGRILLTNTFDNSAFFDLDGDGFAQKTGWVGPDDGLLVWDRNANGLIDHGGELFGSATQTGFEMLRGYDVNGDRLMNVQDALWQHLRVWRDANQDGVSDPNELFSLGHFDVTGINLNDTPVNTIDHLNQVLAQASYITSSGQQYLAQDVIFSSQTQLTVWNGDYALTAQALTLPWLNGFGQVKDLQLVVSENPEVAAFVSSLASLSNSQELWHAMDPLLERWSGVARADYPSTLDWQLGVMAKFSGFTVQGVLPNATTPLALNTQAGFAMFKNFVYVAFLAQTPLGEFFGLEYQPQSGDVVFNPNTLGSRLLDGLAYGDTLRASLEIAQYFWSTNRLDANALQQLATQQGYGDVFLRHLNNAFSFLQGSNITPTNLGVPVWMTGTQGDDTLTGSFGDDVMFGGQGNDTYVYESGNDTLSDEFNHTYQQLDWIPVRRRFLFVTWTTYEPRWTTRVVPLNGGHDTLMFAPGITVEDLMFSRSAEGAHLVISRPSTNDSIRLLNFFSSTLAGIDNFRFDDGRLLTREDIFRRGVVMTGTSAADVMSAWQDIGSELRGGAGNDVLTGNVLNDRLVGAEGNDRLDDMRGGKDTLLAGEGNDFLRNWYGTGDVLNAGAGNDEVYNAFTPDASVDLGEGDDRFLESYSANTVVVGGTGNDTMESIYSGANTYVFTPGDGQDTIIDFDYAQDTIQFRPGVSAQTLWLERQGADLITRYGAGDAITHKHFFAHAGWQSFHYRFHDTSTLLPHALGIARSGTPNSDTLVAWGRAFAPKMSA
jgi:Ca2+-binding RTX toxin-like protein